MPNGTHARPTKLERDASRIYYLMDELAGTPVNASTFNDGTHDKAYNQGLSSDAVHDLALALAKQYCSADVSKLSLEAQIWWRDHQRKEAERRASLVAEEQLDKRRKAAAAKLTDEERSILKIE